MKKKILLSSILTIALCLAVISGATFALFTATDTVTIAVTSGNVELTAKPSIEAIYSAEKTTGAADDSYLVDENGKNYTHKPIDADANGKYFFTNGGEVTFDSDGREVNIARITPGDRVDVKIDIENASTVAIQYRYTITATQTTLADGMVISDANGNVITLTNYTYTSAWVEVAPNDGGVPKAIDDLVFSFELPVYAGNDYAKGSVTYTIVVEAVQFNADTSGF